MQGLSQVVLLPTLRWFLIGVTLYFSLTAGEAQTPTATNLMPRGDMSGFVPKDNPWAGVKNGVLAQIPATQRAVTDTGRVAQTPFSSSVAIGDLNGDGLLDLVVADPRGFFWYYPNSGTKTEPKFTHGEVMPLWVGDIPVIENHLNPVGSGFDNLVPRICLADIDGDGKLDLAVGDYAGKLFYFRNTGTTTQPVFAIPGNDTSQLQPINTRSGGTLWTNYLAPCLYNWYGNNVLDLLAGDGGYSANSIFLFKNKGANFSPTFNETNRLRLVPGMGREQLTPVVTDWNNDGKPDIISGERTGAVNLFLNTSTDPDQPTFDGGQQLKLGPQTKFAGMTTVAVGPLTGNPKTPDLLIADSSNQIFFARNTGTPGNPVFATKPTPLAGVNPWPKIQVPTNWCLGNRWFTLSGSTNDLNGYSMGGPYGVPYELLVVTNPQETPDLQPPRDATWKNILRYFVFDPHSQFFPGRYYPKLEDRTEAHSVRYLESKPTLISDTNYKLTFWVKTSGIHDLVWEFNAREVNEKQNAFVDFTVSNPIGGSSSWTQVSDQVNWTHHYDKDHVPLSFGFDFLFYGQGELDIADLHLTKNE